MFRRTFKYRLYPNRKQAARLHCTLDHCRELYNAALQERRDAWKQCRKSVGFRAQCDQLPDIKECRPEFSDLYSQVLQDVLHRVDKTFKAFFGRMKRGTKPGYPRFKGSPWYDSFTYPQSGFTLSGNVLQLSKIGNIKIKLHRPIRGKIKTLTLKRECGAWYACFSVEADSEPLPYCKRAIGIDVGLESFATLSNGQRIDNPRHYQVSQRALRVAQRRKNRRAKGSSSRLKAVRILQKVHRHVFNQRNDFQHKLSRQLINTCGFIAAEDLNVKGLAKGFLAKSVQDAAWSAFIAKLAYKAANAGRPLVRVDPRGTSQRCPGCGAMVKKKLSDRIHVCTECGFVCARDHASAMEILRLGLSLWAATHQTASSQSTANQVVLAQEAPGFSHGE